MIKSVINLCGFIQHHGLQGFLVEWLANHTGYGWAVWGPAPW